jgi:hypothetical protein
VSTEKRRKMSKKSIFLSSLFCSFVGLFVLIVLPKSVYASFRFVSWADTKSSRSQLATLSRQITDNNLSPVFTIYPGDLESDGFTLSGMNLWKDAINGGSSPGNGIFDITFPTRGNHDFHVSGSTPDWQNYFNMHGVAQRVGATNYRESREDLTYSFDYDNAHFVGIDDDGGAGAITSDDESWLDNDLSLAESRGLTHAFIFFHGPLYPVDGHCCSGNSDIINIINDHPIVSATFHGHEHLYTHTTLDSSLISGLTRSFEQFITGSAGAGPSSARSDREYDYYMNSDGFVTVDVSNQSYTVTWYKLNSSTPQHTMTFTKSGNTTGTTTPTKTPTISPTKTPTPTKLPTPTTTKVPSPTNPVEGSIYEPTDDSFVSSINPREDNGGRVDLVAANINSNIRTIYIKYNLSDIGNVTSAVLRLTSSTSAKSEKDLYVTNTNWDEHTINYTNKPVLGTKIGSIDHLASSTSVGEVIDITLDATKLVKDSNGYVSIAIDNRSSINYFEIASKETNNPPLLIVRTGDSTLTPTPTVPVNGDAYQPTDDTFVSTKYTTNKYGNDATLIASDYNSSNLRTAYLKFNLSGVVNLNSAVLRLTVALDRKVEKKLYATSTNWDEDTLNYTNRPSLGAQIAIFNHLDTALDVGEVVDISLDASKLVKDANGNVSIAVDNAGSGNTFEFYSKEGQGTPLLIVNSSSTLCTPGQLPGDGNGDCKVDGVDYGIWFINYGTTGKSVSEGNYNEDSQGIVDGLDYGVWFINYGESIPPPNISTTSTSTPTSSQPTSTNTPTPTSSGTSAYRAFESSSYWNTPMPANAPVDPNNSKYIADSQNSSNTQNYLRFTAAPGTSQGFGAPIYWADINDPVYTITPSQYGKTIQARIPKGATPMSGSDGGLIVYDIQGDVVIELWQAEYSSSNNTWSAASTTRYYLSSNGLDSGVSGSDNSGNFGHRGISPSSRAVRVDEVKDGAINHRLECFWWATGKQDKDHYWPMSGDEGAKGGIVPEGIVIRIKPSVNLNGRGLSNSALVIARALQDYGCMVGDNSGAGNRLKLELNEEAWKDLGLTYDALSQIPWSNWEFVKGGYDPVTNSVRQ